MRKDDYEDAMIIVTLPTYLNEQIMRDKQRGADTIGSYGSYERRNPSENHRR